MKHAGIAWGLTATLALAAAVAGAWRFLAAEPDSPGASTLTADAAAKNPDAERTRGAHADAARARAGDVTPVIESLVDRGARDDAGRRGPTLRVVEWASGQPLPDARVTLVTRGDASDVSDVSDVSDELWNGLLEHDPAADQELAEHGRAIALDDAASATLPWRDCDALLVAETGVASGARDRPERRERRELHGRLLIRLDSDERVLLRLVRREALTIAAVDPDRRPQRDVPVSLQALRRTNRWRGVPRILWQQPTDPAGEAVLPHGSELLAERTDADGLATSTVVVAALAFPCRDPSPVLVDPRHGCEQPVVVVTPPRSTLRLRAQARDTGQPFAGDVVVRALPAGKLRDGVPVQREWPATIASGGCAELTVEAQLAVQLDATSADGRFAAERVTIESAGRAESLDVTFVMEPSPQPAACTVRVVEPGGAEAASRQLQWQLRAYTRSGDGAFDFQKIAPAPTELYAATTGPHGELRLETAPLAAYIARRAEQARARRNRRRPANPATVCFLELFAEFDSDHRAGARLAGALRLPALRPTDELDLGTLELAEVPLLVGGRALDGDGHGLAQVEITVTERREKGATWTTRSDADGAFRLHARAATGDLDLWPARERWHRAGEYDADGKPLPLQVAAGASDVEFTLQRDGFARGRLLVDPGISLRGLSLGAQPEPAPDVHFELAADGRFVVRGPPGRRSLVVRSDLGTAEPIARVDDFTLTSGEETIEPRFDPIDLRRDLRQLELEVRTADGQPVADAAVWLAAADFGAEERGLIQLARITDPFGRAIVTTPTFATRLIVGSADHFFRALQFEPSFQQVELAPATRIRVRVEGPAEALLASKRFQPWLGLRRASGGAAFDEIWRNLPPAGVRRRDTALFEVRATMAGEWEIWWKQDPNDPLRRALRGPLVVEVGAGDRVLDVVEKLSEAEVARILGKMGR